MAKKILIVLTSHDRLGDTGEKTGFWLEELAVPYYRFVEAGVELTLASPAGGQPPLDPRSDLPEFQTADTKRFLADATATRQLANTVRLLDVNPADHDAIFYPGGHGPLWDLVDDRASIDLIEAFWAADKPVATVCHGPAVLINAKDRAGEPIVKDRLVTAFSNAEEEAVGLTDVVPVSVENALREKGGDYDSLEDFTPYARRDSNLITGQNPASSAAVAGFVLDALGIASRKAVA